METAPKKSRIKSAKYQNGAETVCFLLLLRSVQLICCCCCLLKRITDLFRLMISSNLHSTNDTKFDAAIRIDVHPNRIKNPHHFGQCFLWCWHVVINLAYSNLPLASAPLFFCWFEHFRFVKNNVSTVEILRFPHSENWSVAQNKSENQKYNWFVIDQIWIIFRCFDCNRNRE